jgi:hypothetical protein
MPAVADAAVVVVQVNVTDLPLIVTVNVSAAAQVPPTVNVISFGTASARASQLVVTGMFYSYVSYSISSVASPFTPVAAKI